MGVKVTASGESFTLSKETVLEFQNQLSDLIVQDTPILIKSSSYNGASMRVDKSSVAKHILISDGDFDTKQKFIPRKGKRNAVYAVSHNKENFDDITLVPCWAEGQEATHLTMPWFNLQRQESCTSFSRGPPNVWHTQHAGGTDEIIIGEEVEKEHCDILQAIKFAEEAFVFTLPHFYANLDHAIKLDKDTWDDRAKQREVTKNNVLTAALNLIEEAHDELNVTGRNFGHFNIHTFKRFADESKESLLEKYPLSDDDLVIREGMHPGTIFGFLKLEKGRFSNELFALPYEEKYPEIFELAFSEDMLRKYYPHGAPKTESFNAFEA